MYLKFGQISFWPSKEVIINTMPADFKEKYPYTRVIIDCTKVKCQMPNRLLLNSEMFSAYKNHVTFKGLVGIAPSGVVTFVSQLCTGSISDREIVLRCGFLNQQFDQGDSEIVDKGFHIEYLLRLGVSLNIPPFLRSDKAETNCRIAHNLSILLMNSNCFAIFFSGIIAMSVQISNWEDDPTQRLYVTSLNRSFVKTKEMKQIKATAS